MEQSVLHRKRIMQKRLEFGVIKGKGAKPHLIS